MYYRHVSLENTVQSDLALQMITAINNKKATLNFDIRKVINILKCNLCIIQLQTIYIVTAHPNHSQSD